MRARFLALSAIAMTHPPANAAPGPAPEGVVTGIVVDASVANGPNGRDLKTSDAPDVQLTASADAKTVSLSWSYKFDRGEGGVTQLNLSASTALDDSAPRTDLVSLNGFPGGTEVKLGFTHFSTKFEPDQSIRRSDQVAWSAQEIAAQSGDCAKKWDIIGQADAVALCRDATLRSVPEASLTGEESRYLRDTSPRAAELAQAAAFMRTRNPPRVITFFGLNITGNQDNFKYLDRALFKTMTQSKFGYTGTVFGGWIWPKAGASATMSLSRSRTYDAQRAITLCQPINAIPQTQCITAPDGPPQRSHATIATLDLRKIIRSDPTRGITLAVAPSLSFDVGSSDYSIDVPVYFAQDDKSKLRGGVRLGYLSTKQAGGNRKGDFSLALFVGVPFSLLSQY